MSHDEYFYISHTDPIPAACLQQMRTTRTQQEVTETTFNDRTKKKICRLLLEFCRVSDGRLEHLRPHRSPDCLVNTKKKLWILFVFFFV